MAGRSEAKGIIPSAARGLAILSSPLVLRGLREFPQTRRWSVKQVFAEPRPFLSVSPLGHVCACSCAPGEAGGQIEIHDIELPSSPAILAVPGEAAPSFPGAASSFGWSPDGRAVVAASGGWPPALHLFDARNAQFIESFGAFRLLPRQLCWSGSGKYFVAAASGSEDAALQLWRAGSGATPAGFELIQEINGAARADDTANENESGDQEKFRGFGRIAFHPYEKWLAAALEFEGEWSDDSILLARVPSLVRIRALEAAGRVTDLSWTSDGRQLIFCASGQASAFYANSGKISSLPFAAELCRCHPTLPLCAFFNSWLKRSAKGRVFVADLARSTVVDECWAEGIADLRWSRDGQALYAVAQDGCAYIFERPAG